MKASPPCRLMRAAKSGSATASMAAAMNGIWSRWPPTSVLRSISAGSTVTAPGTSATSSKPYARRSRVEVASGVVIAGSINGGLRGCRASIGPEGSRDQPTDGIEKLRGDVDVVDQALGRADPRTGHGRGHPNALAVADGYQRPRRQVTVVG